MKKYLLVATSVFIAIVVLAIGFNTEFNLSNITSDPYGFIEGFFNQWSPALSAAGAFIAAVLAVWAILDSRRVRERDREQVIHALHDEIHSNLTDIIRLRFQVSEKVRKAEKSGVIDTGDVPFQIIDTAVFDSMKNNGQLHLLENIRMSVITYYKLVKLYNNDGGFQPHHLELLLNMHEGFDRVIRDLEAKFTFLPHYVKERDTGAVTEQPEDKILESKRSTNAMDIELKQELDKINNKLNELNAKVDINTREGNRLTFAVIGFSIAMAGIVVWIQTAIWSSLGNFLIFYGTAIMIGMAFIHKPSFKKWIKIAFGVLLAVLIALAIAIVIIIFVS